MKNQELWKKLKTFDEKQRNASVTIKNGDLLREIIGRLNTSIQVFENIKNWFVEAMQPQPVGDRTAITFTYVLNKLPTSLHTKKGESRAVSEKRNDSSIVVIIILSTFFDGKCHTNVLGDLLTTSAIKVTKISRLTAAEGTFRIHSIPLQMNRMELNSTTPWQPLKNYTAKMELSRFQ